MSINSNSPQRLPAAPAVLALMVWLVSCAGSGAVAQRNSYPDGKGQRSLPAAGEPEQQDWMQQQVTVGDASAVLNYSQAVMELDIARPDEDERELDGLLTALYPDMAAAITAAQGSKLELLPSIDMLDVYQKYTDDRVLAALELELSTGGLLYPGGKQQWLMDLLAAIPVDDEHARRSARALLATAIRLGGGEAALEPHAQTIAGGIRGRFLDDTLHSTVTGFYGDSEELSGIFLRDRLLQTAFGGPAPSGLLPSGSAEQERAMLAEIDNALSASIALRDAYNDFLGLQAVVTNPPAIGDINSLERGEAGPVAIFPYSRSLEQSVFSRMPQNYSGTPMDYLIDSLASGDAELSLQADSGWYEHQQQALETLLLPERAAEYPKLKLSTTYIARLVQAFKASITQRRETQAKNLSAVGSALPLEEQPLLHLEPAPTLYLRTARSYAFLYRELSALPAVAAANERLDWLLTELAAASRRYYAMHCLSCQDIGLQLGIGPAELGNIPRLPESAKLAAEPAGSAPGGVLLDPRFDDAQLQQLALLIDEAADWLLLAIARDPQHAASMSYDPRVCIPVTQAGSGVHNWGVIGVRLLLLEHAFSVPPVVSETSGNLPQTQAQVDSLTSRSKRMLLPVYEYVSFETAAPLTRRQFRKWCDQSRSREEFQLVVNAYGGAVGRSWLEQYGVWIVVLICLLLFRDRLIPLLFPKPKATEPAADDAAGSPPGTG